MRARFTSKWSKPMMIFKERNCFQSKALRCEVFIVWFSIFFWIAKFTGFSHPLQSVVKFLFINSRIKVVWLLSRLRRKISTTCVYVLSRVWLFTTPWTVAHRLLCPWDSPGKNTGEGYHALLQGTFLPQGSNLCLLHCRQILYCWATRET